MGRAAGSHASLAKWLKERDVAVIGSDGVSDVMPSGVEGLVNPLHELVIVGLGMPILDNLDLDPLAETAIEKKPLGISVRRLSSSGRRGNRLAYEPTSLVLAQARFKERVW